MLNFVLGSFFNKSGDESLILSDVDENALLEYDIKFEDLTLDFEKSYCEECETLKENKVAIDYARWHENLLFNLNPIAHELDIDVDILMKIGEEKLIGSNFFVLEIDGEKINNMFIPNHILGSVLMEYYRYKPMDDLFYAGALIGRINQAFHSNLS